VTPRLLVTDALGQRLIAINKPIVTLGRRSDNDVSVADAGVSRLHAEILLERDQWRLKDSGSRFGTFVNGQRRDEHLLAHGDRIRLGHTEATTIVFVVGDELPSPERSASAAASELRHMASLLEGLRALGSGRVLDDVLALVLDAAIDVTGAERGFIMLANQERVLEFTLGRARGRVTLSGQTFSTSQKIPQSVFATGCRAVVEDLLDETMAQNHTGTVALGIRHVICAPLRVVRYVELAEEALPDDALIGVLYLDSRERGSLGSKSTQSALDMLTTEAAMAIENARLYREALERGKLEQDLKVAAAIQQSLLPVANRSGGFFSIAGASIPCREVGGDFFDYVDLPDGRFGFMLGDVAGKGSPAALLAAAVLGMFSAEATYQTSAGAVVTRLNSSLLRRKLEARFLTAFYGILGPDGRLTYSNAGHNPPVLITADGAVRRLDVGGLILGLFEHATFDEETLALQPGDRVIVFSDGVTEAFDAAGNEFTDDRLVAAIQAHLGDGPQALLAALTADVHTFCGRAPATDDVTMLIVQYDGEPSGGKRSARRYAVGR
jgi:sigma-B regulation protein RsbU (phosphoserine phosphatase)